MGTCRGSTFLIVQRFDIAATACISDMIHEYNDNLRKHDLYVHLQAWSCLMKTCNILQVGHSFLILSTSHMQQTMKTFRTMQLMALMPRNRSAGSGRLVSGNSQPRCSSAMAQELCQLKP